jgi:hypothetical protein
VRVAFVKEGFYWVLLFPNQPIESKILSILEPMASIQNDFPSTGRIQNRPQRYEMVLESIQIANPSLNRFST